MEKIAVISGALSYFGSWLIHHLSKKEWKIYALDVFDEIPNYYSSIIKYAKYFPYDKIKKEELLMEEITILFILNDNITIDQNNQKLNFIHLDSLKLILHTFKNKTIQKIILQSNTAYYGIPTKKKFEFPIEENSKINNKFPTNYNKFIIKKENYIVDYCSKNKIDYTILRLGEIYGPGLYYKMGILLSYINYEMIPTLPSNMHNSSLPLIYIQELLELIDFLIINEGFNENFNIVDDNEVNLIDTIKFVALLCNSKFKTFMHLPLFLTTLLFRVLAKFSKFESRIFKSKRIKEGKSLLPKIPWDLLQFGFGDYWFNNEKIKKAGYDFKYSNRKRNLFNTVEWYNNNDWNLSKIKNYDIYSVISEYSNK